MSDKETKNTVNISQFFSRKNEEEGIWYEPVIFDIRTGIEFCLYGRNSNKAIKANEEYQKQLASLAAMEDGDEKNDKLDEIIAELVSKFVKDFRGVDGKTVVNEDGSELKMSDIPSFMFNSPIIAKDILDFVRDQENFLQLKKNA